LVGVSQQTWAKYEIGRRVPRLYAVASRIEAEFGVDPSQWSRASRRPPPPVRKRGKRRASRSEAA
jgi:transcriptional regulator with XRE-family HTH domain